MKRIILSFIALMALGFSACRNSTESNEGANSETKTPVTITRIEQLTMQENVILSATSSYLKKNQVRATVTGYIQKTFANVGAVVEAGQPLFYLRTKEAEALGNFRLGDSSLMVNGLITIKAPNSGILTEVNKFAGDYFADGDVLAVVAQQSSLVFLLNVPYELKKYALPGKACTVILPDSTRLDGRISRQLSTVDPISQTLPCEVQVLLKKPLPENLIASVLLIKNQKPNTQVVDKSSILSDETMENFWVMKLINDTTAVKVPVVRGISSESKTEIISPFFSESDRILLTGQYGLPDTAFVKINK